MLDQDSLVVSGTRRYGRFDTRPAVVDPLAEFSGLTRLRRRLRLKEWVGFTLRHPDVYSSLILQDAHYLASSEFYVYDRASRTLHQHAVNARGGSLKLPVDLMDSDCVIERRGYRIAYAFSAAAGKHRISVDIAAKGGVPAVVGELELDAAAATRPLSVSSRLPGGGRMYTHKAVFPASGVLRVGAKAVEFEPGRDLAILDEHRSLLPYRTRWVWGTFALPTDGGLAGANFVDRPEVAGEQEESCLWVPGACEALADVTFTPGTGGETAPWRIGSADGRLDVEFAPEGRKAVRHQLGVLAIDYFQMFGRYRGTLRAADGTEVAVEDVPGVCESMRARL